ncbi:SRPBCC domain-containing protein [Shimazuella sp. AN120528]|uniref:SRPBCC domain-containing protein n=1 Tax=Shimazuella soli TaxID=1892854 RepID=UPI001F0E775A|nr:SRPBCC domain-containing protein [Shimazuella soli]MCH5583864.1 SRPBCC domain-containing protein [Shimazuella soli]
MDLKYEIYIDGTLEQVWSVLVDPKFVKEIYYGSVIESTFQVGDSLAYVGPGADGDRTVHVYGNILAYEPTKKLSFTHYTGKAYNPDTEKYESRITYQLEKVGEVVKLTLVHDQWKPNDPSYEGSKSFWPIGLSMMKSLVETGKTLRVS